MDDSSCNKGFAKDILDSVTIHGMKRHPKCLSNKKKHKVVQTSKLMTKHYEKIRGILKKHKNDVPGQNATICSQQSASQVTPCSIQHSDRRVRFSGKDDILGPRMESVSSFEKSICNLYLDACASSSQKHQLMGSEKELATVNEMYGDVGSITIENGTGLQRVIGKDFFPNGHDRVDIPNFLRPDIASQEKLKHLSENSISLSQVSVHDDNLHMFDRGNQITSHRPPYAGFPRLISTLNEISNPCINSHFGGTVARASNPSDNFVDYFENHSHGIAEMTSTENMRGFLQPSSSGFTLNGSANVRLPSASENMTGYAAQPCSHLPTLGSLYPFPEWKQRTASFSQNFMNDECFGLPLNSQGELIQASSNDKGSFNLIKKTSVGTGLSSCLPVDSFDRQKCKGACSRMNERHFVEKALSGEQPNLFCGEKYVKENYNLYIPARLGVSGPEVTAKDGVNYLNSGSGSNHPICRLDSDRHMMNFFNGFGQCDQLQNQERNRLIPSKQNSDFMSLNTTQLTMRLMGKDVAISGSSKETQGNLDGKVWTDKGIIADHCSLGTAPDNLSVKRHFQEDCCLNPASGKSIQPSEIQSSEASNAPMTVPGSRPFHPYVNCKTNDVIQNPILPSNGNHSPKSHRVAYLPTFPSLFSRETNFHEPFIHGSEILGVSSHLASVSTPHINQHLHWSPPNPKYKQNHPRGTKSAFNFPFLHPDCSEPVQQSWFRSSTERLLPWLHATPQVKTPLVPCQTFGDIDGRYPPHSTEMNLLATPSVHRPNVVCPSHAIISQSHMQSSVGPASVVHPSSVPAFSDIRPTSSIDMSYGNRNMVIDRMQSKGCGIIGLDHCQKMKKRHASKENDRTKPTKKLNLGIPEDLSVVTELTREDYQRNNQFCARASQCNSNGDRAGSSLCGPLEKQEDASATARLARHNLNQENGQFELYSDSAEASAVGCVSNDSQSIGVGASAGIDSSNLDSMGRSGPVKLSAGAKHIFKPSQNIDLDDSRLVHLTIPFAAMPDSNIFLESQKKTTKIYRF